MKPKPKPTQPRRLFSVGRCVATPGAVRLLAEKLEPAVHYLIRHQSGDWGEKLCSEDRNLNDRAVATGGRLLSAYDVGGEKLWIITEADRSATTMLLPEEY